MQNRSESTMEWLEPRLCFSGAADLTHVVAEALSDPKAIPKGLSLGNSAIFTGSLLVPGSVVDIYSADSDRWSTHRLRGGSVMARAGNKVLLTGNGQHPRLVEFYDVKSKAWSLQTQARPHSWYVSVSAGDKAFFVDGSDNAYYEARTGRWTRFSLPFYFTPHSGVAIAGVPYFVDSSGDVRSYNTSTKQWRDVVKTGLGSPQMVAVGTNLLLTGFTPGNAPTLTVSAALFDTVAEKSLTIAAPPHRVDVVSTVVGSKAIFAGASDNIVGVFDLATGTWTSTTLSQPRFTMAAATAGNKALFAGGSVGHDPNLLKTVDIFTDTFPSPVLSGGLTGNIGHRNQVTIINTGDADLAGPYGIQLYASLDRTLNGAILIGTRGVTAPLPAGASATFGVRTILPKDTPAGTYHLLAAISDGTGHLTPIAAEDATFRVGRKQVAAPANTRSAKSMAGAFTRASHSARQWT